MSVYFGSKLETRLSRAAVRKQVWIALLRHQLAREELSFFAFFFFFCSGQEDKGLYNILILPREKAGTSRTQGKIMIPHLGESFSLGSLFLISSSLYSILMPIYISMWEIRRARALWFSRAECITDVDFLFSLLCRSFVPSRFFDCEFLAGLLFGLYGSARGFFFTTRCVLWVYIY